MTGSGKQGTWPRRGGVNTHLHRQGWLPLTLTTVRAQVTVLELLTPKFKGSQVPFFGVESTVDGQRVLATAQGLPLV